MSVASKTVPVISPSGRVGPSTPCDAIGDHRHRRADRSHHVKTHPVRLARSPHRQFAATNRILVRAPSSIRAARWTHLDVACSHRQIGLTLRENASNGRPVASAHRANRSFRAVRSIGSTSRPVPADPPSRRLAARSHHLAASRDRLIKARFTMRGLSRRVACSDDSAVSPVGRKRTRRAQATEVASRIADASRERRP
jgi:hypothetical protein